MIRDNIHSNRETLSVLLEHLDVPPGWLIAPSSFLVDRIVAHVEPVWLAPTRTGGGILSLDLGAHLFAPPRDGGRLKKLLGARQPVETLAREDGCVIDLRADSPDNWAHFLNIHLAILAACARALEFHFSSFHVLLPSRTPGYIRDLADQSGLRCHYSDAPVQGWGVRWHMEHNNVIRGERGTLLCDPAISPVAALLANLDMPSAESPEALFLSRKDSRCLENEGEISDLLEAHGFAKVYMEDLRPTDQLTYVRNARRIVAVHGAALAPLIYRGADCGPIELIELFPVGHITNVYRAIIAGCGGAWCGVRGQIRPEHVPEIYKLNTPYFKHSLQDFYIDPVALTCALEMPVAPDMPGKLGRSIDDFAQDTEGA